MNVMRILPSNLNIINMQLIYVALIPNAMNIATYLIVVLRPKRSNLSILCVLALLIRMSHQYLNLHFAFLTALP